jgi:hypothetical protein
MSTARDPLHGKHDYPPDLRQEWRLAGRRPGAETLDSLILREYESAKRFSEMGMNKTDKSFLDSLGIK